MAKSPIMKGGFEPLVYEQLKKSKVKVTYEESRLPYVTHHNYVPDFEVSTRSGVSYFLEVKGYFRTADQVKMKAVKAANPNLDIRLVFQKDNKVNKFSKMYYSDWAEKYGFPYAIGEVPKEWLE
jgi:hypothetical protein